MPFELLIFAPLESHIPRITSHAIDGTRDTEVPRCCCTFTAELDVHLIGVVDVRHNCEPCHSHSAVTEICGLGDLLDRLSQIVCFRGSRASPVHYRRGFGGSQRLSSYYEKSHNSRACDAHRSLTCTYEDWLVELKCMLVVEFERRILSFFLKI